jgi:hypothetical protein
MAPPLRRLRPTTGRPGLGPGRARDTYGIDTTPRVLALTPNAGNIAGGTVVTITGHGFNASAVVQFGTVAAAVVVYIDEGTITAVAPASEAGIVDVSVQVGGQGGTLVAAFTYYEGHITAVTPNHSLTGGGLVVRIAGLNFVTGSTILFGTVPATGVTFVDDQQFIATVPASAVGARPVTITITEPGGAQVVGVGLFRYTSIVPGDDIRRQPSVAIRDVLNNAPNMAAFTVDGRSAPPEVASGVDFSDEGALVFSGTVQRSTQIYEGKKTNLAWQVQAVDRTYQLNRRRPFGTYDNQSVSDIVRDLVLRYAPGFTVQYVQARLPRVSIVFDGSQDFATCLSQLAQRIGEAHWYVDYQWRLHFFRLASLFDISPAQAASPLRLGPGTAMTVSESAVPIGTLPPGYYYFRSTSYYGHPPTWGASGVSAAMLALLTYGVGYVQLSNEAAALNLTGTVSNGTYASGPVAAPGAGTITGPGMALDKAFSGFASGDVLTFGFISFSNIGGYTDMGPTVSWVMTDGGSTVVGPRVVAPTLPQGGSNLAAYVSVNGGPFNAIAGGLASGQAFLFNTRKSLLPTFPLFDASAGNYAFNIFFRGWIGFNGATVMGDGSQLAPGGAIVYYASRDVAAVLEAQANQQFESTFSPISNIVLLRTGLPTFTGIPIGPTVGAFSPSARRIYFVRLGDTKGAGGTRTTGYLEIADNVTTGRVGAAPAIFYQTPPIAFVSPPNGALAAPLAADAVTLNDPTAFLGANFQAGYYAFMVTAVYQNGTESKPCPQSNTVLLAGTNKAALANVPIFANVNGVAATFRKVYASIVLPFYPLTPGIADFGQGHTNLVAIIPNNTATAFECSIGGSLAGGDADPTIPVGLPPGLEDTPGPDLEELERPADLVDGSALLLLDPPLKTTTDMSQLRNRVMVKGKGTIVTADAPIGATSISVADVSGLSPTGGAGILGSRVLAYLSLSGAVGAGVVNLAAPLTQPVLQADWKYGGGTPFRPFVVVEDLQSQRTMGAIELDINGLPTDGVHEYLIDDDTLVTTDQCLARGLSDLQLFSRPLVTLTYSTRDPLSKSGKRVRVNLTNPPVVGEFIIQEVSIDQYRDAGDKVRPRYNVTADSAARFNFNDLLLDLDNRRGSGGPSLANITQTAIVQTNASGLATAGRQVQGFVLNGALQSIGTTIALLSGTNVQDATEIAPMVDAFATQKARLDWATMTTTAAADATSGFRLSPIPQDFVENAFDVWFHVKTPADLANIILWVGLGAGIPTTYTAINGQMCCVRYANFPGSIDSGWTAVVQASGVGHTNTKRTICPISPATEYVIRIQGVQASSYRNTAITFTVNGVATTITYADTVRTGPLDYDMPTANNGGPIGACFMGVVNKGTAIRKFSFRRVYATAP